ncbi:MAG: hypothetical protein ACLR3C_13920 [Eggerthella lenta]
MNELHVDLSFPYCPRRCDYCDAVVATGRVADFERYADALVRELRGRARGARAHRDVGALLRGLARAHAAQSPRARHGRAAERVCEVAPPTGSASDVRVG